MDLELIGVTAASISAIRQCGPDRAAAGVHGAAMSALIVNLSSSFFSSWRPRAAPFKRRHDLQQKFFL
jgi:hypothetical protein